VDPENPVVKLCAQGMMCEAKADLAGARLLFEEAWAAAGDDYERCVAAHYLARHQDGPEQTLRWNEECLKHADLVGDERVAGFYPSLYLNIGHSWEVLGDRQRAGESYRLAEERLCAVPPGPYADMVKDGITRGLERVRD
jgi:hypothetical protein